MKTKELEGSIVIGVRHRPDQIARMKNYARNRGMDWDNYGDQPRVIRELINIGLEVSKKRGKK